MRKRTQLPLTALRAFEVAGRLRGLKEACEELHLKPGAISQQVRALEERVGVRLFDRTSGRYALTQIGAQLLSRLTHCFDDMEVALEEVVAHAHPKRLRLKLAPSFASRWFAPRLADFFSHSPGIELEVTTVAGTVEASFEQCDFLVRFGIPPWPDLDAIRLFGDDIVPVCSPEVGRTIRKPTDLRRQTLLHSALRPHYWRQWLTSAGLDTNLAENGPIFPDAIVASEAAANGSGVAIMQWAYVQAEVERGRLVTPIEHHAMSENAYYMVSSKHRRGEKKIRDFSDWVKAAVAK